MRLESLRKREDFDLVFDQPDYKIGTRGLYILAKKNDLHHSRLGMAIGKKVIKKASRRNALKRRLRIGFTQHINRASVLALDCVVLALAPIRDWDNRRMTAAAQHLFAKLNQRVTTK